MSISFYYSDSSTYPDSGLYNPDKAYPEYPFHNEGGISKKNDIYEMIREVLILHGLDSGHINKVDWNPLGYAIKPGNTVLIKPNLVNHINRAEKEYHVGMQCLITHPSVIRCIFDYVYIALKGYGRIIVADAPVQGCDYGDLLDRTGYGVLFAFFESMQTPDLKIETADLRECIMEYTDGKPKQVINMDRKYSSTIIDLESDSYFSDVKNKKGFRVTCYAGNDTATHHKKGKNEYCISNAALEADVIINVPKPKTHGVAGYTGALKNLIGINARKEYLPHYTRGSKRNGGDEYDDDHLFLKYINGMVNDYMSVAVKKQHMKIYDWLNSIGRLTGRKINTYEKNRKRFGIWYGNDTIWRSILDINKIILYSDKNGVMRKEAQRKVLSLGDMVVCGEKEGPLSPTYKKVGGILFSENPILFDFCVVKLMGFKYDKIPTLFNAIKESNLNKEEINEIKLCSNEDKFNKKIMDIKYDFGFKASSGWVGVLSE